MIGFRVDANEQIATGHLMRCMAIAAACRKRGEECLFLLAEDKETARLEEQGFAYRILHTRWDQMEEEIEQMREVIRQESLDVLAVDSYQATVSYLAALEREVPVLYIDDLGQESYHVSVLLHYGVFREEQSYREKYLGTDTKLLIGTPYIPLREEFLPTEGEEAREKSILITTGGTDPYNITGKVLEKCMGQTELAEYAYHVIVGSMNSHAPQLQCLADRKPQIHLHTKVSRMSDYMRTCEMAVSAGGTTVLELCACGIPSVCFSFADNQQPGTKEMGRRDVIPYAGDARYTDVAGPIVKQLQDYGRDSARRERYAKRMKSLVDGLGAGRIAAILVEYGAR